MLNLTTKRVKFRKVEFWAATLFLVIAVYSFIDNAQRVMSYNGTNSHLDYLEKAFREKGLDYNYFVNTLYPNIAYCVGFYLAFIFLNNWVIPRYYPQRDYSRIGALTLVCFAVTLTIFSLASYFQDMHFNSKLSFYFVRSAPVIAGLFCAYFLYALLKRVIEFYLINCEKKNTLFSRILRDTLLALAIWIFVLIWLISTNSVEPGWMVLLVVFPYAYAMYQTSLYRFIPRYEHSGEKPQVAIARAFLFSALLFLPFMLILATMGRHPGYLFITWLFATAAAKGIAYLVYQQHKERIYELLSLKEELGKANTGLQFLRSQINPHFLFNALNTLYGASLQENATKTGEGIQKLGDMMRFMLHENHQDTIALTREIDYLRDYIHLQKLRLAESADIRIETIIQDEGCCQLSIAPMLLIPFVENAFKHGISLQRPSWIKMALKCEVNQLYFDIYNSIHRKREDDPEQQHKGIGLDNVKQRLQLIYPGRHELVIRENESEYFVHLTLRLN